MEPKGDVFVMNYTLSICIPARSEEFLVRTIQDILQNKRGNTEIIVGLDGEWSNPPIPQHPDVNVIYYPQSIGQRAMTNQCVKLSRAKYVLKLDAHCALDEGFDLKMIEAFNEVKDENVVMAPLMRNLWVYDWKCYKCGKREYQDRIDICPVDGNKMKKKMLWIAKKSPRSTAFCFDSEPHFQYHNEQRKKQVGDIVETMSLQGSCFMTYRHMYWKHNICDEAFGSWGSQGIEIACKFWLSGGQTLVNRRTWYAHCFRTKAVFGFPYKLSGSQVQRAKRLAKDIFFNNRWPGQTLPLSWLVEKFMPVPGWSQEQIEQLKKVELKPNN